MKQMTEQLAATVLEIAPECADKLCGQTYRWEMQRYVLVQ